MYDKDVPESQVPGIAVRAEPTFFVPVTVGVGVSVRGTRIVLL
jgi:hypothetical protein